MKKVLLLTNSKNVIGLLEQTPNGKLVVGQYEYFINDVECPVDYVVSYSKGRKLERKHVSSGVCILITGEPSSVYRYSRRYMKQFTKIYSSQDINLSNVTASPPYQPWWYGRDDSFISRNHKSMTWDDLRDREVVKRKVISLISSTKIKVSGHIDRVVFTNFCKRSPLSIDVYGRGYQSFEVKDSVLEDYKYHIVIENSIERDYISEKLTDALLAGCYVFYHGAPNVFDYFPNHRIEKIDIRDPHKSIAIIEKAISDNKFEKSLIHASEYKTYIMNDFNLFYRIPSFLDSQDFLNPRVISLKGDFEYISVGKLYIIILRLIVKLRWMIIRLVIPRN